jgi:hypothetical protein
MSPGEVKTTAASVESAIRDDIPGTTEALKKLAYAFWLAVAAAIYHVLPEAAPVFKQLALTFLPGWLHYYGTVFLDLAFTGAIAWLAGFAKKDVKQAVATAYVSEPGDKTSNDIKRLYSK